MPPIAEATMEPELHEEVQLTEESMYRYLDDDSVFGPDTQWEVFKHTRIANYEPVEERFMSESQRAMAAAHRRRDRAAQKDTAQESKPANVKNDEFGMPSERHVDLLETIGTCRPSLTSQRSRSIAGCRLSWTPAPEPT